MDPYICCLLGICCPPNSAAQLDKASRILFERKVHATIDACTAHAKFDIEMVQSLRDGVWKMVRG